MLLVKLLLLYIFYTVIAGLTAAFFKVPVFILLYCHSINLLGTAIISQPKIMYYIIYCHIY